MSKRLGTPLPPHPLRVARSSAALKAGVWHRRRRVNVIAVSCRCVVAPVAPVTEIAPAKDPPVPAYNVAAGHSQWSLRVSDVGGSRRSYRNGRASAVAEAIPFPKGTPKSSVGGTPGWNMLSSALRG